MVGSIFKLPPVDRLRIGLFGGSFNPAHDGHFALAQEALVSLQLDFVWWMVSPQNPLKPVDETGDFDERMEIARQIAAHPRFIVTDLEARLGTRTTAQTLKRLAPVFKRRQFVWLMGADSFAGLHRWNDWQAIPQTLPLAVFDRPGWSQRALSCPAARRLSASKLPLHQASLLVGAKPPCWSFITMPLRGESSTQIRQNNGR